jgi:fructosamine-3-kinase
MNENGILEQVETALGKHFGKKVKVHSSSGLGGGCINHASKITSNVGDFFLKWNAHCAPDIFLREAESLRELKKAAQGSLVIPEVFVSESAENSPGFLLTEYLEPGYSGANIDEKLGRGLALIHRYQNDNFGFYHNNYCGATTQNLSLIHI